MDRSALSSDQLDTIDIHSLARYHEHGYPWDEWALLRENAPAYWYERNGIAPFWAVSRYEDVKRISLDEKTSINNSPLLRLVSEDYEARRLSARQAYRRTLLGSGHPRSSPLSRQSRTPCVASHHRVSLHKRVLPRHGYIARITCARDRARLLNHTSWSGDRRTS